MRLGLHMLLDAQPGMEIIAEVNTATEAIILADILQPDIVLMDIGSPNGSGINGAAEINRAHPEIGVIALTIHEDHEYVEKMLSVGARGYVSKRAAPDTLLVAINEVACGQIPMYSANH